MSSDLLSRRGTLGDPNACTHMSGFDTASDAVERDRAVAARIDTTTPAFGDLVDELRALARWLLAREPAQHTLQPTALVNELWLRMLGREGTPFANREAFLAYASVALRHLLVDHARRRRARRLDGRSVSVEAIDEIGGPTWATDPRLMSLPELDEELRLMERDDPVSVRVFEMRYFGGMRLASIADALNMSERTVRNRWNVARFWLRQRLDGR